MPSSRSLTGLIGALVLGVALTACEEQALGTIEARGEKKVVEHISNPSVDACHRFVAGMTHVANWTQQDMILYQTADCTEPPGGESVYLPTLTSDAVVRSTGLWRSFTFVH
jgi:hypothetical protein